MECGRLAIVLSFRMQIYISPLVNLLSEDKPVQSDAAARIQQ